MNFSLLFLFLSVAWAASNAELMRNLKVAPSGSLFYRFHPVFYRDTVERSLVKQNFLTRSYSTVDGVKVSKDDLIFRLQGLESDYQRLISDFPLFNQSNPKWYGSVDVSEKSGIVLRNRSSSRHPYDRSLLDASGSSVDFWRMYDILVKVFGPQRKGYVPEVLKEDIKKTDDPSKLAKTLRGCYLELDDDLVDFLVDMVNRNRPRSLSYVLSAIRMSAEKRAETLTALLKGGLYWHRPEICETLLEMSDFELDREGAGRFDKDRFWNAKPFHWHANELINLANIRKGSLDFIRPTGNEMMNCWSLRSASAMLKFLWYFPSPSKTSLSWAGASDAEIMASSNLRDILYCLDYNESLNEDEKKLLSQKITMLYLRQD